MTAMTAPTPTRRPFRPTPAWLIYGLLVVEGLLWLSERYPVAVQLSRRARPC